MDAAHFHLILNHFPIIGTLIAVAILAYGLYAKNDSIKKVALVTFILMAILTIPVFLTGQEAEEVVEHIAGVSEDIIEEHEELAEKAIWLMGVLGVLAIINFYSITAKISIAKTITIITFAVSLATVGLFAKVGNEGGQIRHSEIRAGFSDSSNKINGSIKENRSEKEDKEEHDDDD